jgi:G3E family GTPase
LANASPDFTPVTLITGFLGSGKTTLLQRLLRDPALSDTAVLLNEFGEIGLDHHLLERIDEKIVMLQSGCVCCTIRGELSTAIKHLHSRRERGLLPPFRRLVIESTGLADPFPILSTVRSDPVLRHHFCLGNVITTVDAVNGARQLDAQSESIKQVAVADRLVLTKTDLTTAEAATRLTKRLRHINPGAPLGVRLRTTSMQTRCCQPEPTKAGSRRIPAMLCPTIIIDMPTISVPWRPVPTSPLIGRGSASG